MIETLKAIVGSFVLMALIAELFWFLSRLFYREFYERLTNSIHFSRKSFLLALIFISLIVSIQMMFIDPFSKVQAWIPNSYLMEQIVSWLFVVHFFSIVFYAGFLFYLWRKFDSLLPAFFLTIFVVGLTELTFIPQHLLFWNLFVGYEWYSYSIALISPFIIERRRFLPSWKAITPFLAALFLQYIVTWFLLPWSWMNFVPSLNAFQMNLSVYPHPPIGTWVFGVTQIIIKLCYILAFSSWMKRA